MDNDVIFQPLRFRNLTVKNRLFRSNISGSWPLLVINRTGSECQELRAIILLP